MAENKNNGAITVAPQTPMQKFNNAIRGVNAQKYLETILGKEKKDAFVSSLVSVVASNTDLQACEPMSLVYTAIKAAVLDLSIDPSIGEAAVIPYNKIASFQIMRNGWVELLMRTGKVMRIANEPVHEGELIHKNKFTGDYLFNEDKKKSDKIIGYMAYVKLTTGLEKTVYWTVDEVKEHAKTYSKTYRSGRGIWFDNFDGMALKTVLKHLIVKYCPKTKALQQAIKDDQITVDEKNQASYEDNPNNITLKPSDVVVMKKEEMRKEGEQGSIDMP